MIKIEKNVPLVHPRGCKYPFGVMDVGDSFAIPFPNDDVDIDKHRHRIDCAAHRWSMAAGRKYTVRILREDREIRCWRTE